MKSVLISIQPKWVEKICNQIGEKNGNPIYEKVIEVRKTRPKLETPFKCYIYMTKNGSFNDFETYKNKLSISRFLRNQGKVKGEFICDKIIDIKPFALDIEEFEKQSCLSALEIARYLKGLYGYGWHISDLKIYDKPKELSEFRTFCDGVGGKIGCNGCEYYNFENTESGSLETCCCNNLRPLKRPPQSWCYIESLGE